MKITMRKMLEKDRQDVFVMMREFYNSPLVIETSPDEILMQDITDCVTDFPYVEGFILEADEQTAGYAMTAKGYSTEFGCLCIWVEDLYIKSDYRGQGIADLFFKNLEKMYEGQKVRFRLEAEHENEHAMYVYRKNGYKELPYVEMTKEVGEAF